MTTDPATDLDIATWERTANAKPETPWDAMDVGKDARIYLRHAIAEVRRLREEIARAREEEREVAIKMIEDYAADHDGETDLIDITHALRARGAKETQ